MDLAKLAEIKNGMVRFVTLSSISNGPFCNRMVAHGARRGAAAPPALEEVRGVAEHLPGKRVPAQKSIGPPLDVSH